jgi:hypothetical protein
MLPTITDTPYVRPTLPPTWTPTFTFTPTNTPTNTSTFTPTYTSTPTFTVTPSPTFTPTPTLTPRPTRTPSLTPTYQMPAVGPVPGAAARPPAALSPAEARLWAVPILPSISGRMSRIFTAGQAQGRQANAFTKVGDCHTATDLFMVPLGVGEYDLGGYGALQRTIDFFSASLREGVANSFVNTSIAASSAFNAAAVLDSTWSPPDRCMAGEVPLDCEYRLTRPSVAIILLGSVDMQIYDVNQFRTSLSQVVGATLNQGIIPVLMTFPSSPAYLWETSLAFNLVIVDIAQREQIPLINFWRASRTLPDLGLRADHFHLSHREGRWLNFGGEEQVWGVTLQNLLVLQTLDRIRSNVLAR